MTFSVMAHNITTLSIIKIKIKHDTQHNDIHHNGSVTSMLSVAISHVCWSH
jgi:hypothetical protein